MSNVIRHLFNCEKVTLFAIDNNDKEIFSKTFTPLGLVNEIRVPISNTSILGYVASTGKSIVIQDAYNEAEIKSKCPGYSHDNSWDIKLNFITKSMLTIPLEHEGTMVGIVQFINSFNSDGFKDIPDDWDSFSESLSSTLHNLQIADLKEKSNDLIRIIDQTECIDNILVGLEQKILNIFETEMVTIYVIDQIENKLYSKIKSGGSIKVIRLPISDVSIAGYVAMSKQVVNIEDVYNSEELNKVNPNLKFNSKYDKKTGKKSSSMLVYPLIFEGELNGVMQLVNKKTNKTFTSIDETMMKPLAEAISASLKKQLYRKKKQRSSEFQSLINSGYISELELKDCYSLARKENYDIETLLLNEKNITREQLGKSLELHYSLPYQKFNKSFKYFHSETQKKLRYEFFLDNHFIPIQNKNSKTIVIVNNPENLETINNIKMIFRNKEVEFRVGLKIDIEEYIYHLIPAAKHRNGEYSEIIKQEAVERNDDLHTKIKSERRIKKLVKNQVPFKMNKESGSASNEYELNSAGEDICLVSDNDGDIVRLANKILTDAHDHGASDIHIEPGIDNETITVRFRKDGRCFIYQEIPAQYKKSIISRIKIMAKLDIAERRLPQDGKIKLKYGSKNVEYRVVTIPTSGGNEDAILRVLAASKPFPIGKMSFSERNLELLKKQITKPYGLILVVGPTGSGKTTTLHSFLGEINKPEIKIWTAEDPIEITQKGLRQVQVQKNINFDFADAMKTFLRGDPDVIMVGEMRDQKTCSIGLEASLTGHLVFSTLHTNSAPETIVRLVDLGMNPLNFADALLLIVAQRLVLKLCSNCKKDYHPSQKEFDILAKEYGEEEFKASKIEYHDKLILKKPVGCSSCNKTGYAGRIGLHELLNGSDDMKRLIMNNGKVEDIRKQAKADGMTTIKQDGILKIFKGDCDLRTVLTICPV